jgi:protein-disulfide isomerase
VYNNLIDSLYIVYNVKTSLYPPNKLTASIDSSFKFSIGNPKSNINVYYLFNTECSVCKETFNGTIKRIIEEYKDEVCFSFIPHSKSNNLSLQALYSASLQNSFWQFFEFVMKDNNDKDIGEFLVIADSLNLDIGSFKYYVDQDTIFNSNLMFNFQYLSKKHFYGTPTIVINNQIVDSFDYLTIKQNIDKLLSD